MIVYGAWYQQPKINSELDVKTHNKGKGGKGGPLNVNARIMRTQLLTDEYVTTGLLLPDEEVDLSFETSGKIVSISFK